MEISLAGKVAIVTGANSGIGLAITRAYLACGVAGVIAVDCDGDLHEDLSQAQRLHPDRLQIVRGDVAEEQTAIEFSHAALSHFGRIDVLVNNAGVSVTKPLHLHSPEEWNSVMDVNVKSLYWASRHIIPVMIEQSSGLILITGSISGETGLPKQGAYAASKGALHQMTRQMAIEYAPFGIRVNAIACGTVDTPMVHRSAEASGDPEAFWRMVRSGHPIGQIATPEEVANVFSFVASDLATFFTGAVLMFDGGYTAR
jgi:NAD(P)-dependent dehydrogenase (short-subunit alcohol dehydrogenase family)